MAAQPPPAGQRRDRLVRQPGHHDAADSDLGIAAMEQPEFEDRAAAGIVAQLRRDDEIDGETAVRQLIGSEIAPGDLHSGLGDDLDAEHDGGRDPGRADAALDSEAIAALAQPPERAVKKADSG